MNLIGPLRKLASKFADPIEYSLVMGDEQLPLNPLLGKTVTLSFLNQIYCIQCQRKTSKSFQQGYCYPCYQKLLDCNLCIIHPERCKHPYDPCPDTWEHQHCKQEHIVYIANSSGLKVGITRHTQIPTRWIDQGAVQAMPLFKVSNRHQSGLIEVCLKQYRADKTNWRKMLQHSITSIDMKQARATLLNEASQDLAGLLESNPEMQLLDEPDIGLNYPVINFPIKLNAISLDKQTKVTGVLAGIKGQYLLFENEVINIRKHSGYQVTFQVE